MGRRFVIREASSRTRSGRARPEPIEGAFETIETDVAIIAIGNAPNPVLTRATPELATTRWGTIEVDEKTGLTSMPGVFAGGDITTGSATVILTLGAGRTPRRRCHRRVPSRLTLRGYW